MPESWESLPNLQRLRSRSRLGIKKGLDNTRALLEALGSPQLSFPSVLIAGTNGKGSVGAFLAHALRASGRTVGWTTSPHLVNETERVWIDGGPIGVGALELLLGEAFDAEQRAGVEATYFELMITAALLAFRMTGVEVALLEVGLGGRWDSTNAVDPMLTVLTSVGLDHQQYLGSTREAIAREKLCTTREGHPLVLGPGLDPEWIYPLLECAPTVHPAKPLEAEILAWDHSVVEGHRVPLAGAHQVVNLATALETIERLRHIGFPIFPERLWKGIEAARWPGRLWKVPGFENIWMDGAHNPDGARALASHALRCGIWPHVLFGAMGDKDIEGVAAELLRMEPRSLAFVRGADARYAAPSALRAAFHARGADAPVLDIKTAAKRVREHDAAHPGELLLVTGSLYLLGDLMRELKLDPWG
ncbi:MAG TPA: Mur ligase family protein [Holophagaceae bacterium]|jgi:dihydrofolate synthase/folylpolyglutamate synthase|nr:Mur ligase family protein [Holophagaceae bacterium]